MNQNVVLESLRLLPDQIQQVMDDGISININQFEWIDKIVVNWMWWSNLWTRLIISAFRENLKIPILNEPWYSVSDYVDKKTLYIVSSYSWNTEEPITWYFKAKEKWAKILVITQRSIDSKNKLEKISEKDNIAFLDFDPNFNPSDEPRYGIWYSVWIQLLFFIKLWVLDLDLNDLWNILDDLKKIWETLVKEENFMIDLTNKIKWKALILVSGDIFEWNTHILRNQINESSKNMCFYLNIPELNHYALEWLGNPETIKNQFFTLFFKSDLYDELNKKRLELSQEVFEKNNIQTDSIQLTWKSKLHQTMEFLYVWWFLSYYLWVQNWADPKVVPWVDRFKEKLG